MPPRKIKPDAERGGIRECARCQRRYSAGGHPDPIYGGQCGLCRPRVASDAFKGAAEASKYRIELLVKEGRMRDSSGTAIIPASRPEMGGDRPEWEELL